MTAIETHRAAQQAGTDTDFDRGTRAIRHVIDLAALVQVRFSVQYEAIISGYLYKSILRVQDSLRQLMLPAKRLL
ncbi:MAG TPA: hypothetical protein DD989_09635 [Pseudomonas sp.]|nr:hypothetical protein [Pseudomonas sp.]